MNNGGGATSIPTGSMTILLAKNLLEVVASTVKLTIVVPGLAASPGCIACAVSISQLQIR